MSHLDEFASDVQGIVADLDAQAGVLNERKNRIKDRGNEIMGRWAQYFDGQDQALRTAEAALNRISNVPLSGVSIPKPKDVPLSDVPLKDAKDG